MKGFTRTLEIQATPAKVFGVLTDLDSAPKWMPAIQKTEWLKGTAVGPGAQWHEWRLTGKRTMKATLDVIRFEKDRALTLHVTAPMFGMDLAFDLEKAGKATKVVYNCMGTGKGLMRPFTGPMMRSIERHDDDLLLRLKAFAESA